MCPTRTSSLGIRYHCNCAKLLRNYSYLVILVVLLTCDSFFKCAWLEKRYLVCVYFLKMKRNIVYQFKCSIEHSFIFLHQKYI